MKSDTIVALATPPGTGGIAIIRLSGPQSQDYLQQLHSRGQYAIDHPRELTLGRAQAGERQLGDALAVSMPGPRSYTGEDVAELHLHGGRALVESILRRAYELGARAAEPGEFTKRAFLDGKLDLAQAEAVADVIAADSAEAANLASSQLAGALSQRVQTVRAGLIHEAAALAANLDFGDEDVSDVDESALHEQLSTAKSQLNAWLVDAPRGAIVREGYRVALVGLPNAGKSSLLNALVGYDRAIVTAVAGTTRDTLEEAITIDGLAVRLTDTAGITTTDNAVEQIGVELARQTATRAQLILLLCPADQDPTTLIDQLPTDVMIIGLQTQIDRLEAPLDWPKVIKKQLHVSAMTGAGLNDLRQLIHDTALGGIGSEAPILANLRHIEAVELTLAHLDSAIAALEAHQPHDIIAGELTLAADALGQITGESVNADIINAIFHNFCIGK